MSLLTQAQEVSRKRVLNPALRAVLRAQLVDGEAINRGERAPTQAFLEDVLLWAYEGLDEPPGYWVQVLASGKLPAQEERRALAQRALSPDTTGSLEWARGVVKKARFLYSPEEAVAGAIVYVRGTPEEQKEVKEKALALRTRRIIGVYKDVLLGKPIGCRVPDELKPLVQQRFASAESSPELLGKISTYIDTETTRARWYVFFDHWSGYRYITPEPDAVKPPYLPLLVLLCVDEEAQGLKRLQRLWEIHDAEGRPWPSNSIITPNTKVSTDNFYFQIETRRLPVRAAVLEILADLPSQSEAVKSLLSDLSQDLKANEARDLRISPELRLASVDAYYRAGIDSHLYAWDKVLRAPGPFWPEYAYLVWNIHSTKFDPGQMHSAIQVMNEVYDCSQILTYWLQKKGWLPWEDEGTTGTR